MSMKGLWVTPDRYLDFTETDRTTLVSELATRARSSEMTDIIGALPDPDPVLRKLSDAGVSVLEELTADAHLLSAIQQRKLGTLNKEFFWSAGGEEETQQAKRLAEDLTADLERIDLYALISGLLDAPYYGSTPVEIRWEAEGGRMRIADLSARPARWFCYDDENRPRFKSIDNPWAGEELPFGKFVFARHFPTYDNPYGLRLLSRCLWPIAFKKGGIKFWVQLAEKFGVPFLVGKYSAGTTPAEQSRMLQNLAAMVQSAVAVIPSGGSVEILDGAKSASADIHRGLKESMDAEISKVIMGQTLTAEVGSSGSYAAGKVHADVLEDFRLADQRLVKSAMEEIAWLYGQINAPGVPVPVFTWFEIDDPKKEFADRDKTLKETGVRFTRSYYQRQYGLEEDDFELDTPPAQPPATKKSPASFAESSPDTVDRTTDRLMQEGEKSTTAMIDNLAAMVKGAGSLEELQGKIAGLYDRELTADLGTAIARSRMIARLAGRAEVADGD